MTASTIGAFACRSRYVSLKPSRQGATPPKIGKPISGGWDLVPGAFFRERNEIPEPRSPQKTKTNRFRVKPGMTQKR